MMQGYPSSPPPPPPPPPTTFHQPFLIVSQYPYVLLGGGWNCASKLSCPRTQHIDWPGLGPRAQCTDHLATALQSDEQVCQRFSLEPWSDSWCFASFQDLIFNTGFESLL